MTDETGEIFAALEDGDDQPLRAWLRDAGVDVEAVRALPQWNAVSRPDAVSTALSAVAGRERGVALLLIYLLLQCENTWEVSYHYGPIWAALRDGIRWRTYVPELPEPEQKLADAVRALLEITDHEIQVENAMTSGRIGGFGAAAEELTARTTQATMLAAVAEEVSPAVAAYVTGRARAAASYYAGAAAAGHGLGRFLGEPGASLTDAIERLARAEADPGLEPNRASELRAHRFSLQALQDDRERPWLRVDRGKILYIYPFALQGSPAALAEQATAHAGEWELGGVRPEAVHGSFNLDDVWDGTDLFGRAYDGTQIELPRVTVRDLTGKHLATLTAEVRLSTIGNHYLRLEAALTDANPQDVYSAMFRAAPEHGMAVVSVAGSERTWPRLSDLAQDVATAVAENLGRSTDGQAALARDDELARRGPYHVLVVVDAASVSHGPAGTRDEVHTHEELLAAVGAQVLGNPVTHCVSALAEWSRYPLPEQTNILSTVTHRDDMVVRTANTTVFVALGSPSFHTQTRETVAEFVASLDGLFAGWSADLTTYYQEVEELLGRTEQLDDSAPSDEVLASAARLRDMRQRLADFVTEVRSTVAMIDSPGLVASPVVSAMKSGLLAAAGFRQRAEDLDRRVEQVLGNRLVDRIEETARGLALRVAREEEERERRQRARMDTALAVVAAVGISGLGQIIQAGFDVRDAGAIGIALTVLGLAGLFGLLVRRASQSRASQSRARNRMASAGQARASQASASQARAGQGSASHAGASLGGGSRKAAIPQAREASGAESRPA